MTERIPHQVGVTKANNNEAIGGAKDALTHAGDSNSIPANIVSGDLAAKILRFLGDLDDIELGGPYSGAELQELIDEFETTHREVDEAPRGSTQRDIDTPDDESPGPDLLS